MTPVWLLGPLLLQDDCALAFCHAAISPSSPSINAERYASPTSSVIDHDTLPFAYSPSVPIAIDAVRKAFRITQYLQSRMSDITTLTKDDASPVTVADFASQAAVLQHLQQHLPVTESKVFLAEEESKNLTPLVTGQVLRAVDQEASVSIADEQTLRDCIDLGQTFFSSKELSPSTYWCLDPIDGTKGFLRKGQYCVALGLVENGSPTIGILACPNLPFDDDSEQVGCIFVACKDHGCYQLDLNGAEKPRKIGIGYNPLPPLSATKSRFCVGVEQGFGDPTGKAKDMAKYLHGSLDENDDIVHAIRMDSQAKYGVVARGNGEFYVRLPRPDYQEWIWDVAPGVLVLEEAGGKVTDAHGNPLDFSTGAKLSNNYGVLGAIDESLYQALLKAYQSK
jgi:3'(2'), 5'-bisphosphate nucleotidase